MRYAKPDPANPTGTWIAHTVSEQGQWPAHGIGVGDINGDGRLDIVGAKAGGSSPLLAEATEDLAATIPRPSAARDGLLQAVHDWRL